MKKYNIILFIVLIIINTGCTKPKDGINGTNSNSNVNSFIHISSNWVNNSSSIKEYDLIILAPEITEDIKDKGSVQILTSYNNVKSWFPMPFTLNGVDVEFEIKLGEIDLACIGSSSTPLINYFKVVVINN